MSTFDFSSYGTNIAGTVTAAIIFGIAWTCKNKCKHSKCAVNSGCIQFSADDVDTIHEAPIQLNRLPRGEGVMHDV